MPMARVSAKFQVVIPKKIREEMKIKPGEQLHVYFLDGSIRLHRPRPIQDLRGSAKGLKWQKDLRDHSERF